MPRLLLPPPRVDSFSCRHELSALNCLRKNIFYPSTGQNAVPHSLESFFLSKKRYFVCDSFSGS